MSELLSILAAVKNSPTVWAQATHFLIAYSVMLTAFRLGERRHFYYLAAAIFATAVGIEVWYDPRYEGDPFFWGGALDLAFYAIGAAVGWFVDSRG